LSKAVLDASALLAMLLDEPGGDRVARMAADATISVVNLSEAADYYARQGMPRDVLVRMFADLPVAVATADAELAIDAAMLRPLTNKAGLSLGDRFCLALARRLGCEAVTADHAWLTIAEEAGVRIALIR